MSAETLIRLSQAARKLNVGHNTILDFLLHKGFEVENNPNAKLTPEQFALLSNVFAASSTEKLEASGLSIGVKHADNVVVDTEPEGPKKRAEEEESNIMIKNLGSKDLIAKEEVKPEKIESEKRKLEGIKVVGKIALETKAAKEKIEVAKEEAKEPDAKVDDSADEKQEKQQEQHLIKGRADKLQGLKVLDRIELP
jgi:translation initiation factor IF-2